MTGTMARSVSSRFSGLISVIGRISASVWGNPVVQRNEKWVIRSISIVLLLILWELYGSQPDVTLFAPPSEVVFEFYRYTVVEPVIANAIVEALQFTIIGYFVASVIGVLIGFLIGFWQPARDVLDPTVDALYVTPTVALLPLIIAWFGLGFTGKLFFVINNTVYVIIINSAAGVTETPVGLVDAARVFGASDRQIYTKIHFRHAFPYILNGLRLGAGRSVRGMIAAELFLSAGLLGQFLVNSGARFQIAELVAGIASVSLLGIVSIQLVRMFETRILSYRNQQ